MLHPFLVFSRVDIYLSRRKSLDSRLDKMLNYNIFIMNTKYTPLLKTLCGLEAIFL